MTATPALLSAALLTLPLLAARAEARSVTPSQLSAAPYGRVPIRSNRPEWEVYNGNRPGGSPSSGILGYPGAEGMPMPYGREQPYRRGFPDRLR